MVYKFPNKISDDLQFDDIAVGAVYSFERIIDEKLVSRFTEVSGDYNPLHMDEEYAQKTPFGKRIAHGMLAASFFSALVGMACPGRHALYLSQSLQFRNPISVGSRVSVSGTVTAKSDATQMITLAMAVRDEKGILCVEGEAKCQMV